MKNKEFKDKAVFLATQAKDNAPHYEHTNIGYNYRMSNICAGIGRGQMEVLSERIAQRRANHQFYHNVFQDSQFLKLHTEPTADYFSNHWLSVACVSPAVWITRADLIQKFEDAGIETRPIWKPMHLQPVFKNASYFGSALSEKLFNHGLCLPSRSNLSDSDRDRITDVLKKVLI